MIRVEIQPIPSGFDFEAEVARPGANALALLRDQPLPWPDLPGAKLLKKVRMIRGQPVPKTIDDFPYWQKCLGTMHKSYHGICAYFSFYIEPLDHPQADHFVAKTRDNDGAYDWRNLRLACAYANTAKNSAADILDPADIQDGWFQLNLHACTVRPDPDLDSDLRARIEATIARIKLNGTKGRQMRARALRKFAQGNRTLSDLQEDFPFIHREMFRQGVTRPDALPIPDFTAISDEELET